MKPKALLDAYMDSKHLRDELAGGVEIHALGGWWGNHIEWMKYPTRLWGHRTPLPKPGDLVECDMKSGRTFLFRITSVEGCRDPHDMFFAEVEEVGYVDDLNAAGVVVAPIAEPKAARRKRSWLTRGRVRA